MIRLSRFLKCSAPRFTIDSEGKIPMGKYRGSHVALIQAQGWVLRKPYASASIDINKFLRRTSNDQGLLSNTDSMPLLG